MEFHHCVIAANILGLSVEDWKVERDNLDTGKVEAMEAELKERYRILAVQHHTDRNTGDHTGFQLLPWE